MRFSIRLPFFLVALFALMVTGVGAQTFTGKAQAVAAADHEWSVVFGAKDLEQSLDFLEPDASVLAPNAPIATGRTQIGAFYKAVMSIPGLDFTWHASHVEVAGSGDLAYSDGEYRMSYTGADGKPVVDKGKYVTVWHLGKNGAWRVVRDIFNSDLPVPTP